MAFDTSLVGCELGPFPFEYGWKEVALYALACGATTTELDLLLETRGPKVLPTYAAVIAFEALHAAVARLGGNPLMLVHAGQRCSVTAPLPPSAKLWTTCRLDGLYDKGKGALAQFSAVTRSAEKVYAETEWQMFYRGQGGFGGPAGPRAPTMPSPTISPERAADARTDMPTSETQALLYRLASGDLNPIHADPGLATHVGFERPILHGLCTLAFAARAVVAATCAGDSDRLRSIEGRFARPVLPGQTLTTETFRETDGEVGREGTVAFLSRVGDIPVLSHGRAAFVL